MAEENKPRRAIFLTSYIHYTYENIDHKHEIAQLNLKKTDIWMQYLKRFNDIRVSKGKDAIANEQLIDLLNDFSGDGPIGQGLERALNDDNFWKKTRGKIDNKKSQIAVDSVLSTGTGIVKQRVTALENASEQLQIVNDALQDIIDFLYREKRSIVLGTLINYVNVPIPKEIMKWLKNQNGVPTSIDYALTQKGESNLKTLGQQYEVLKQVSKGEMQMENKNFYSLLKSLQGCFSVISGEELFEDAVVHGVNKVMSEMDQEVQRTKEQIEKRSTKSVSTKVHFRRTGSEVVPDTKTEIKPDIVAKYTKDGVEYEIGGSLKLRQSAAVQAGKAIDLGSLQGKNGKSANLKDVFLQAQATSPTDIDGAEKELLETMAATYYNRDEKGKFLPFTSNHFSPLLTEYSEKFEELKTYGLMSLFFERAFGQGGLSTKGTGNLAGFILVNNRVVTAREIYLKLVENISGADSAFRITDPTKEHFISRHENIFRGIGAKKEYREATEPSKFLERSGKMHDAMDRLLQTKMRIELSSFMNLFK